MTHTIKQQQTLQDNIQFISRTNLPGLVRLALVIAAFFFSASICSASATNVYVAQNSTGAANGGDCADALPVSWFNNAANWGGGSSQIGPGTTVHLCGTFTGSAGGGMLTFQGSGTSGNPVTVLFESGANLTAPYWGQYGAILTNAKSYLVINGGTNGIIQNTANGSGLAYEAGSVGIDVTGSASNITIENLTVANICQFTNPADTGTCTSGGNGTNAIYINSGPFSNILVTNNTVHDVDTGIGYYGSAGDSAITISNNTLYRNNWGVGTATIGGTSNGLFITGNDISCVVGGPCNWTDNYNNHHHNGVMIFPQGSGDIMQGVVISNNYIHDINPATGGIFVDPASGNTPGIVIYNNVFYTTPGQSGPSDGSIVSGIGVTNAQIFNNTVVGPSAAGVNGGGSGFSGPTIKNNVISGTASFGIVLDPSYTGVASDYNDFYGLSGSDAMAAEPTFYATVTDWVSGTGFDTHTITSNPNLTASFALNSGSPAIGKGTNLTSLGIAGLNVGAPQFFGVSYACGTGCVARPSSGAWDLGAYQFSTTSTSTTPAPPTGLSAIAQ